MGGSPVQFEAASKSIDKDQIVFVVKWVSSLIQILGYAATAFGMVPLNLYLFLFGVLGWFSIGALWNDRAIMLVHLVAFAAMIAGMLSG